MKICSGHSQKPHRISLISWKHLPVSALLKMDVATLVLDLSSHMIWQHRCYAALHASNCQVRKYRATAEMSSSSSASCPKPAIGKLPTFLSCSGGSFLQMSSHILLYSCAHDLNMPRLKNLTLQCWGWEGNLFLKPNTYVLGGTPNTSRMLRRKCHGKRKMSAVLRQ